jgi:hypothetical protein
MVSFIWENGKVVLNKDMEYKPGPMELNIKEIG